MKMMKIKKRRLRFDITRRKNQRVYQKYKMYSFFNKKGEIKYKIKKIIFLTIII